MHSEMATTSGGRQWQVRWCRRPDVTEVQPCTGDLTQSSADWRQRHEVRVLLKALATPRFSRLTILEVRKSYDKWVPMASCLNGPLHSYNANHGRTSRASWASQSSQSPSSVLGLRDGHDSRFMPHRDIPERSRHPQVLSRYLQLLMLLVETRPHDLSTGQPNFHPLVTRVRLVAGKCSSAPHRLDCGPVFHC